jgi:hypothetical protein
MCWYVGFPRRAMNIIPPCQTKKDIVLCYSLSTMTLVENVLIAHVHTHTFLERLRDETIEEQWVIWGFYYLWWTSCRTIGGNQLCWTLAQLSAIPPTVTLWGGMKQLHGTKYVFTVTVTSSKIVVISFMGCISTSLVVSLLVHPILGQYCA